MELRFLTGRDSSKHCVLQALITEEIRDEHGISRMPKWVDVPTVKFIDTLLGKREEDAPNKHLPEDYAVSSEFAWFDLPWSYDKGSGVLSDKHDGAMISTAGYGAPDVTDEQGEFIVQACNSYHRREALLLEALDALQRCRDSVHTREGFADEFSHSLDDYMASLEAELKGGE